MSVAPARPRTPGEVRSLSPSTRIRHRGLRWWSTPNWPQRQRSASRSTVPVYQQLCRFAARWPHARWAIEGAAGLGAPLTERLRADRVAVIDVPAKLARRVRMSTGHGRKTDEADALSVSIAAWSASALRVVEVDEAIAALRALTEHRDDLVRTRTQLVNRLHALLVKLVPSGLSRGLSDTAAEALRRVRPRSTLGRTLRQLAADLVGELRRLDRRIATATTALSEAVAASRTTLTRLHGVGDVVAAKILARTGPVNRFASPAAFASFCGVAPIEVSSGYEVRHRLSRAGDRQLNYALHVMAITQIRRDSPGRTFYQRKRAAGGSHMKHCDASNAGLADTVYRHDPRPGFLSVAHGLTQTGADHGTDPRGTPPAASLPAGTDDFGCWRAVVDKCAGCG
jgi:transposase